MYLQNRTENKTKIETQTNITYTNKCSSVSYSLSDRALTTVH